MLTLESASLSLYPSLSLSLSLSHSLSLHTEAGDFTDPSPVTLSFPAGMTDTTRDVLVPTLDDDFKEADETIICTVTILESGQQEIGFPNGNSTTITILDNDGESVQ